MDLTPRLQTETPVGEGEEPPSFPSSALLPSTPTWADTRETRDGHTGTPTVGRLAHGTSGCQRSGATGLNRALRGGVTAGAEARPEFLFIG